MSNWWKRFFGLEGDSDEIDPPAKQGNHERVLQNKSAGMPHKVGRFEDPHRDIEVKIVNHYPSSSDSDRRNLSHPSRFSLKMNHLGQGEKNPPPVSRRLVPPAGTEQEMKKTHTTDQVTKRSRFVATSVPSPVYGFRPRPNFAISTSGGDSDKEQSLTQQEGKNKLTGVSGVLNGGEEVNLPLPQVEFGTHSVKEQQLEPNRIDFSKKIEPAPVKESIQELKDVSSARPSSENEKGLTKGDPVHPLPLELPKRESKMGSEPPRPLRPTSVPYNVMLLETDRLNEEKHKRSVVREPSLSLNLLNDPDLLKNEDDGEWIEEKKTLLSQSLKNFNVKADVLSFIQGPTVTRFEIRLHPGVKVNKVMGLTEDLKLALSAKQIRIAPISGKNTVGIEIPNQSRKPVHLKSLLQSKTYQTATSPLTAVLGQDISGNHVVTDLAKMPHGLIAGATGSGKSVCIHSLILSLIYKATPDNLRFILIDPKVVELATYRDMPHLAAPVITQTREAALALKWAVDEMENRYQLFADTGVRDLSRYNDLVKVGKIKGEKLPYIVIVIDELADLMMTSPQEVEAAICRIAQKARAAGIHMLLATQRPSVDVITGLIKSNIPTRIAFSVSAQADSRTILDMSGAERLLGQGDLLFSENGSRSLLRLQGTFVTDEEIERITGTFKDQEQPGYLFDASDLTEKSTWDQEEDELFEEAGHFVIEQGQASVSSLQRRFRIGYNRAARLVDQLEAQAVITESNGSKPRQVLMDKQTFEQDILSLEKMNG